MNLIGVESKLLSNNNIASNIANYTPHPKTLTKIAIIGDSGVGKSCIVERFTNNTFSSDCIMTVGFNVITKANSNNCLNKNLFIFLDVSGNSNFEVLRKSCYKGVKYFLAVCDITSAKTLVHLETIWIPEIISSITENNEIHPVIKIIGNKKDLKEKSVISSQDLDFVAKKIESKYPNLKILKPCQIISAKDNVILEKLFKSFIEN